MSDTIQDEVGDAMTPAPGDPRSTVASAIEYANTLEEGDRVAVAVQVFSAILDHAREGGTFRHLIYDRLGFSQDAYVPLYYAGGMHISDNFVLTDQLEVSKPAALDALESIAEAEAMVPHPTLKRADGTAVPWPTQKRSDLFAAVQLMHDLLESNRALVAANRHLSAQCENLEKTAQETAKPHKNSGAIEN